MIKLLVPVLFRFRTWDFSGLTIIETRVIRPPGLIRHDEKRSGWKPDWNNFAVLDRLPEVHDNPGTERKREDGSGAAVEGVHVGGDPLAGQVSVDRQLVRFHVGETVSKGAFGHGLTEIGYFVLQRSLGVNVVSCVAELVSIMFDLTVF